MKRARHEWQHAQSSWDPARLVFIDDTWVHTAMTPTRGRAPRGERCLGAAPHGHWKTITFVAALRCDTVTAPLVRDGPIDGACFLGYVKQFLCATLRPGDVVIAEWNLTVQREIVRHWVVSVGYAGNRGVHLFGANYNMNQLDPQYFSLGLKLQDQVPNPYYGQITSGALSGKTVAQGQLLNPLPVYLSIYTLSTHGAASTYHAFQLTVERRFAAGLSALVSYNKAKLINDASSSNAGSSSNPDYRIGRLDRRGERSLDENDIPQRLVVSAVYELPFGPGKSWLKAGVAGAILGGWQLNGIFTYESGGPAAELPRALMSERAGTCETLTLQLHRESFG